MTNMTNRDLIPFWSCLVTPAVCARAAGYPAAHGCRGSLLLARPGPSAVGMCGAGGAATAWAHQLFRRCVLGCLREGLALQCQSKAGRAEAAAALASAPQQLTGLTSLELEAIRQSPLATCLCTWLQARAWTGCPPWPQLWPWAHCGAVLSWAIKCQAAGSTSGRQLCRCGRGRGLGRGWAEPASGLAASCNLCLAANVADRRGLLSAALVQQICCARCAP
jgi:hypothetical protein